MALQAFHAVANIIHSWAICILCSPATASTRNLGILSAPDLDPASRTPSNGSYEIHGHSTPHISYGRPGMPKSLCYFLLFFRPNSGQKRFVHHSRPCGFQILNKKIACHPNRMFIFFFVLNSDSSQVFFNCPQELY